MLQTDQRLPAVGSQKGTVANPDTSVDVYFGPTAPARSELGADHSRQRLERPPTPLRPAPAVYDKTWRPGEIELTKYYRESRETNGRGRQPF